MRASSRLLARGFVAIWALMGLIRFESTALAGARSKESATIRAGRELFVREWKPGDRRSHGGDGLGPVFNARSCAECHNQGGVGGGGSNAHDVEIATLNATGNQETLDRPTSVEMMNLAEKAGIFTSGSFVLHQQANNNPDYAKWRGQVAAGRFTGFTTRISKRNTPPLFGAGLIDAIPDEVIETVAAQRDAAFPEVRGRPARFDDGRVGRFGWKAQKSSLRDFVLTACSVELGLEVPEHHQASDPSKPPELAEGLDMNEWEADALVEFVENLPRPVQLSPMLPEEQAGNVVFTSIGCAACHVPRLGNVGGIYSDLLLHDLGRENDDTAVYYGSPSSKSESPTLASNGGPSEATGPEWRTAPLWGMRHSAPYMHDGQSWSLNDVMSRHGGEALETARRYNRLSLVQKAVLRTFLLSLEAPRQPAPTKQQVHRAKARQAAQERLDRFGAGASRSIFQPPPRFCGALGGMM
jgi:CxxC motif-containing protein (DUF1111 family)